MMRTIALLVTAIAIGMAFGGTADPSTDPAENMTQPAPAQCWDTSRNAESVAVPAKSSATRPVRHCGPYVPCPRGYCCMHGLCYQAGDCV